MSVSLLMGVYKSMLEKKLDDGNFKEIITKLTDGNEYDLARKLKLSNYSVNTDALEIIGSIIYLAEQELKPETRGPNAGFFFRRRQKEGQKLIEKKNLGYGYIHLVPLARHVSQKKFVKDIINLYDNAGIYSGTDNEKIRTLEKKINKLKIEIKILKYVEEENKKRWLL